MVPVRNAAVFGKINIPVGIVNGRYYFFGPTARILGKLPRWVSYADYEATFFRKGLLFATFLRRVWHYFEYSYVNHLVFFSVRDLSIKKNSFLSYENPRELSRADFSNGCLNA